jgi:predicted Ser/Thr protein kinase
MNATSCPDRETLTAYVRGTLAEDAAKAVDGHLPLCDQCNAVLAAIEGPDDEVVAALRESPSPNPFAAEPEYHRAVAELRDGCAAPVGAEPTQSFQPTTLAPFAPGDCLLGRYEIRRELGRGGMGVVYVAWDRELSREVAVKVPALDRLPPGFAETFLHEARTAAGLEHPGIIRIYDFGRHEGVAFAVMQYVDGPSLKESLASQPVSHARAVEILIDIAEALHYAHKRGFIHRDLKPGNVLMDKDEKPHIADFGLAIHESEQESLAGSTSGTAAYMAPEQARGQTQWLDGRADLWALGVILYEMLTHRRPFQAATPSELRDEILHREPKPPRMIDDSIPASLEAACLKCLSKDVKGRYSSARDLVKALRKTSRRPSAEGKAADRFLQRWYHQFSARLSVGRVGCAFVVTVASLLVCVTAILLLPNRSAETLVATVGGQNSSRERFETGEPSETEDDLLLEDPIWEREMLDADHETKRAGDEKTAGEFADRRSSKFDLPGTAPPRAVASSHPGDSQRQEPPERAFRVWTDATGKFQAEAAFLDLKDGKVWLKKKDGNVVSVPLEKLSKEDYESAKRNVPQEDVSTTVAMRLDQARSSLQKLQDRLAKSGTGGNRKSKTGPGGSDGSGVSGRSARAARWVLVGQGTDIRNYLMQLDALGAAFAVPGRGGQFIYFRNMASPSRTSEERDLSGENRIYWTFEKPSMVREFCRYVGIPNADILVMFLPLELEERMAEMERNYQGKSEGQIAQTRFRIIQRDGRFDVIVAAQVLK